MNRTFQRQGDRDHKLWNIATDFIMNRDLLLGGYTAPKLGCLTSNENGELTKPGDEKQFIDLSPMKNRFKEEYQDADLMIDITNFTCEQVYDLINDRLHKMSEEDAQKLREILEQIKEEMDKHPTDTQPGDSGGNGIPGHGNPDDDGEGPGEGSGEGDGEGSGSGDMLSDIANDVREQIEKHGTAQQKSDLESKSNEGSDKMQKGPAPGTPGGGTGAGSASGGYSKGVQSKKLTADTIDCSRIEWSKTLKHFLGGDLSDRGPGKITGRKQSPWLVGSTGIPLSFGRENPSTVGNNLKAIFILDVSGSMGRYFDSIKEGIACLAKEFLGKLDIQVVLIGSQAADPIIIQSSERRDSVDDILDQINEYWEDARAAAGGTGIGFGSMRDDWMDNPVETHRECQGALDWLYHMGIDDTYKYVFVITDTEYTDDWPYDASAKYEPILKELLDKRRKIITVLSTNSNIRAPGDSWVTSRSPMDVIDKYHSTPSFGKRAPKPQPGMILSIDMHDQILPNQSF